MRRRDIIRAAVAVPFAARAALASDAELQPFDPAMVRQIARDTASNPFRAPDSKLPDALARLDYNQYRDVRFKPDHAIWRGTGLPFQIQLFHRGFIYAERVDLYEVTDGKEMPILYNPEMFDFGKLGRPQPSDLGYAGFRIHAPFNRADYFDEVCVFLGASYFRAVGRGQAYGLSARGLSIRTGNPGGEEFPLFRSFWIERPTKKSSAIVVHALLDSPSAAAAFRFTIRPGADTVFDTEMTLFPRTDISEAGIGTVTSMFLFDANSRNKIDDYRPAVHDSNGLLMLNGNGERLWRPLGNPNDLQVSAFGDAGPQGFGLMQRKHDFAVYEDLEAKYERRPSLWVEPIGDFGKGAVTLVEIPTRKEIHDNIVAFWRPNAPLKAKGEFDYKYRLHWCAAPPGRQALASVVDTRSGLNLDENARLFVLDIVGDSLQPASTDASLRLEVSTDRGAIRNPVVQANPHIGGLSASFELVPAGPVAELRAQLRNDKQPLSEVWVYRWTR